MLFRSVREADTILRLLGLYEDRFEMGTSLPYGSQRKLEIARALATRPKLLLLDEPAAGMNEQETEELRQIVYRLKEMGYTILLIEECPNSCCCGRKYYDFSNTTMVFLMPGEIFRMSEENTLPDKGYLLAFHPNLLSQTSLKSHIQNYTFFQIGRASCRERV